MNSDPVVRFSEQVLKWNMCFDVFGLIRRDALDRTEGMGGFSHGDGVLLAHLALLGPSKMISEVLFLARQHPGQSMQQFGKDEGGNDYHSYAAWFDPKFDGRLTFPHWSIIGAYRRVVGMTGGWSFVDRARLHWVLGRRMRKDVRLLTHDLLFGLRFCAHRVRLRLSSSAE